MKNNTLVYTLTCVAIFGLALAILFGLDNTRLRQPTTTLGPQDWRPMNEPLSMPPVPERYIEPPTPEPPIVQPDNRTIDTALIKGCEQLPPNLEKSTQT